MISGTLKKGIDVFDKASSFDILGKYKWEFWVPILLIIFDCSVDCDGCGILINNKEMNITFFKVPEINLNEFN